MDLFSEQRKAALRRVQPLAVRMRPRTLEEFVGQQHFLGPGKLLRRLLDADRLTSAIFYGPPGTGKTTLAQIIANRTKAAFEDANAAAIGVKEIRDILSRARDRLSDDGQRTVLFLDEIHRFNRAQQDVLLGDVEDGIIILIGATTENPFFAVNAPLVSRSQIFQFEPLSEEDITTLMRRALVDKDRGLGGYNVTIADEALAFLATTSDGDARRALTAIEVAVLSQLQQNAETPKRRNAKTTPTAIKISLEIAQDSIQHKAIVYDGTGDEHYDAASALIKSMRGSDPDATVYWLARMLEAGEDPRFIARRIAICAAEDVGNADPMALVLANAAVQTTVFVGLPECQLPLAQAAIYIACAPKSNASAMAIWSASSDVKEGRTIPVPRHLRDAHYKSAARLGHGEGYQYAHDSPDGMVAQDYLGVDKTYYTPTDRGHEKEMAAYLEKFKKLRGRPPRAKQRSDATGEGEEGSKNK
ncbi:MAG TPA: replication-associated recombination protein A [Phycisphaerae bacterium]|nr:replication-associated recombination protein A [Phycisphaerae bacterium]